tara:strand:- start:382 stop:606 length:225 start_codon:yes stop_codon:yes gene_type:complete
MSLRPNEFVEFLKGMALGIEDTPTINQWKIILQKLMDVEKEEDRSTLREITKEVERIVKPFKRKPPGTPPDIFF